MKTTILFAVLLVSATLAKPQPGLRYLLVWQTARSTALAGDTRTPGRALATALISV